MVDAHDHGSTRLPKRLTPIQRRFVAAMLLEKYRGPAFGPISGIGLARRGRPTGGASLDEGMTPVEVGLGKDS